jgi:hypothetical protein
LSKCQSAFQPNDSTVNQLIEIYHNIISNMDRGRDVRYFFCDVSKAFDKVWHKGLLLHTWAIFHKRGTCLIEWDMLKIVVSGLEIE